MSAEIDLAALSGRIADPPPEPTRITIIFEHHGEVSTVEVENPRDAQFSYDAEEPDPYGWARHSSDYPPRTVWKVRVSAEAGPEGFTETAGREHARQVLRRIAGEDR